MRDIGVFAITVAVLLVFTINSAYAQSPDIYTSNQTTLSDNLKNNSVAQEILKKIEQTKKQVAEIQKENSQRQEELEQLQESRQKVLASLEQSLKEWEALWEKQTFEYKFEQLTKRAEEYGTNVFWDQYNFTYTKILAGQKAYNQVLQNGGNIMDARSAYIDAAKISRSELIEVNSLFNVKHNLALYNQQIMFDRNGQFHDIVSGEELRKYYEDYRANPSYLEANADDKTARDEMSRDANTECRMGQTLVYRFHAGDYVCVSDHTAELWVKIGTGMLPSGNPEPSPDTLTVEKLREDRLDEKIKNINQKIKSRYVHYENKLEDVRKSFEQKYHEINEDRRLEEKKVLEDLDVLSAKETTQRLEEIREKYDMLYDNAKHDRDRSMDIMESTNKNDMEILVQEFDSIADIKIVWDADNSMYKAVKKLF